MVIKRRGSLGLIWFGKKFDKGDDCLFFSLIVQFLVFGLIIYGIIRKVNSKNTAKIGDLHKKLDKLIEMNNDLHKKIDKK